MCPRLFGYYPNLRRIDSEECSNLVRSLSEHCLTFFVPAFIVMPRRSNADCITHCIGPLLAIKEAGADAGRNDRGECL